METQVQHSDDAHARLPADGDAASARPAVPLRVILADDDALSRRVLRDVLEAAGVTVIATTGGGREAVELARHYQPDVVVMDLVMPGMDGFQATRQIVAQDGDTKVLVLSSSDDEEVGLTSLQAGAVGFVSKSVALDALPRAVESAHRGEAVVSRRLTMRLIETVRRVSTTGAGVRPVKSPLTSREWEVLDLMCEGCSTEDIADALVLSTETVRSHIKNLLRKLGVRSRQAAIAEAARVRSLVVADPGVAD